jgi:signal peptidase I
MPSSNENDAKSISKLALLASAAATAAFVISQTRVMQRLTEPAPTTPPEPDEPPAEAPQDTEPVAALPSGGSQAEAPGEEKKPDDHNDRGAPPPPPSGGGRLRFRTTRPARERLHYGLPVTRRRRRTTTSSVARKPAAEPRIDEQRSTEPTAVALLAQPAVTLPAPPAVAAPSYDAEEFDAEYLALVEAIARDGLTDDEADVEEATQPEPAPRPSSAIEDMWWLPAPKLQYIFAALIYVGIAAAVGSDPVVLTGQGIHALTTVNSTADLILVGWILCGIIVLIPLGAIATRLVMVLTRGRLFLPGLVSADSIDSAGWGIRFVAISAFVAGVILYTPNALGWALNTDHPVASVASSSMSPTLHEGELVLIDGVASIDDLRVGDIVAFQHEHGIAIRRVSGFSDGAVLARADAGPDEDFVIPFENITGRVLTVAGEQVKLPLLGNISLLGEPTVDPNVPQIRLP